VNFDRGKTIIGGQFHENSLFHSEVNVHCSFFPETSHRRETSRRLGGLTNVFPGLLSMEILALM
jgi:hypothetical protein